MLPQDDENGQTQVLDSGRRFTEGRMGPLLGGRSGVGAPPVSAYTIWTGIGAVGAFIVGIAVLCEQLSAMRIIAVALIVSGIVLMKLSTSH